MKRLNLLVGMLCLTIPLAILSFRAHAADSLSYADLLNRYTNMAHLAVLPPPGETCTQHSSWDRRSRYDSATGKYVDWAANGDNDGMIRVEDKYSVMAEMEGPGCIWRTWSARAESGHVKIFLDGQEIPAVDMPFANFFDGQHEPFNYPKLAYDLAQDGCRGFNLYMPIPYQKSCKIVAEKGWGAYYQFVYTTFPKGTEVPTFSKELVAKNTAALKQLNDFSANRLSEPPAGNASDQQTDYRTIWVGAGNKATVLDLAGPRAITAIRVATARGTREEEMAAARGLVLKITWDDQKKPAVWCPLGDFFGTAPGVNFYKSLVTGITETEGGYAYWYMPFAKKAKVELVNDDQVDHEIDFQISHAPLDRPFEGLGYFHAKWHRDVFPLPKDRWPDWVILRTQGRGRFCGVMLHVWNPMGGWWGEGDEKFFVDGEVMPSTFGTGSEDYFGYAWCNPNLFQRPFHCQTMDQRNAGHQSVFRWHVADAIPFQKSFEGCIEKYYTNEAKGTRYAVTTCWYLAPDGVDPFNAVPMKQRHDYYVTPPLVCGGFRVVGRPKGVVQTQDLAPFGKKKWQKGDQLWWTNAKPGNKLDLELPVPSAGTYALGAVLTKAPDYGIVQLYLDGQKIGQPLDLYNPTVMPTEPIPLGTHNLAKEKHVVTIEIVGANKKAIPSYMFGLDYFVFEPVE